MEPTHKATRGFGGSPLIETREEQLLKLVGELLQTNQDLRFTVERLEQAAERTARTDEESSALYALLMP